MLGGGGGRGDGRSEVSGNKREQADTYEVGGEDKLTEGLRVG